MRETYRLAKKLNIAERKPSSDFSLTSIDVNTSSYSLCGVEEAIILFFHRFIFSFVWIGK